MLLEELQAIQSIVDDLTRVGEVPFPGRPAAQSRLPVGETVLEKLLCYWRERLAEPLPILQLPTDRPYPATPRYRLATHSFVLPGTLIESLRSLAHAEQCTLFMLLLSTFKLLLYRYCDQENIIVGSPGPQRNRFGTGNHVLLFDNLLALRTDLSGKPSFRQLLRRVRETCLGAFTHHALPLRKLIEALYPERAPTGSALFRVVFALGGNLHQDLGIPGVEANQLDIDHRAAGFDLSLSFDQEANGLRGVIGYNPDLFDSTTIDRMAGHFRVLLESAASNPGQTIQVLPILSPEERRKILVDWNDTEADYPGDQCIHQLFESQVRCSPNAPAVTAGGISLSYEVLNSKANQLANRLRTRGVKLGSLVGIFLERSPQMVVAMLAVLKAGGAYVPLDPSYPEDRRSFIIRDSQAVLVITESGLRARIDFCQGAVPILDVQEEDLGLESESDLQIPVSAENLAYVMYTSGSTGTPKGVAIPQRAVVRLVINTNHIRIQPGDTVAQISSCSFDPATLEFWGALLNGACLTIIPRDISLSPGELAKEIDRRGISIVVVTTALFRWIAQEAPHAFSQVRYVIFGGEAAQPSWISAIMAAGRPEHLIHHYGPTEAGVAATSYEIESLPPDSRKIPIGRPISNTTVYILDSRLQPTPIGVPGELHIGGAGVARGYLHRPELTAEKFIPNPFSNDPGARLYKTGDLARYLADGNIEFIGRKDDQVKIRGYRIEPGEVEFVLKSHPLVAQAAAVVREDDVGEKQLVAYVVSRLQVPLSVNELRAYLLEKVPSFMIPSVFIRLNELPLNANGKTDRHALPAPETQIAREKQTCMAPRTATEKRLAGIWAELLKIERIGIHDDFLDLGGHSLLATRIIARIRNAFNIDLPLPLFFEIPTVAALSNWIDSNRR